jgi:hypothetical protein
VDSHLSAAASSSLLRLRNELAGPIQALCYSMVRGYDNPNCSTPSLICLHSGLSALTTAFAVLVCEHLILCLRVLCLCDRLLLNVFMVGVMSAGCDFSHFL